MRMGLVTAILLMTAILPLGPSGAMAAGERGGGHQGGHGAIQGRSTGHEGSRGSGGTPHHQFDHRHHHRHHGVRTGFFIGSGFGWGDPWWWGPAYPDYLYPPEVVQETPLEYIQQEPEPAPIAYWYYCQNPQGYYPYIKECPGGWLTVVPPSNVPAAPH